MTYYGEVNCQEKYKSGKNKDKQCLNNAYYKMGNKYLCGVHSSTPRTKLPINPNKHENEQKKYENDLKIVKDYAKKNYENKLKGDIVVSKLKMMKKPEDIEGYLKVFPNYKHQNRKDGFGCSSLSPMSLGPIEHKMPNLPIAKNLENYHQFAKFFAFEMKNNVISNKAIKKRIEGYNDEKPHRHKFSLDTLKKHNDGVIVPLFSMYYDKYGKEHRYGYIECRYFYCHWYEKLVSKQKDFKYLVKILKKGYNIQIVGYDGYNPTLNLYDHYLDPSQPFGHELVLYSMLYIDDPEHYPWNIYYEKHKDIYKDVI